MQFKRRAWQMVLLSTGVPLVALVSVVVFFLLPRTRAEGTRLASARRDFQELVENIRGLEGLRARASRTTPEVENLFIPKERPLAFIETLEDLAARSASTLEIRFLETVEEPRRPSRADDEESGLGQSRPAPQKSPPPLRPREQGFELRLMGSFASARAFLSALEEQPLLLRVDEVLHQAFYERPDAPPKVHTLIRLYAPLKEN